MTYRLFAVTAPGLEDLARAELTKLGLTPLASRMNASAYSQASQTGPAEETGGVEFDARPADLMRANLHLRTVSRLTARLGSFDALGFDELHKKATRLGWREFIKPGQQVAIRATCKKSRLYHSDAVAREVAKAISTAVKGDVSLVKPDPDAEFPPQLVVVRIVNDECTISIDTSGALLHRRGYRLQTAKAPLRETLAAGLLLASGWNSSAPLVDPFCGSGTIPIEAALLAGNIAPGKSRKFAFMDWPNYKKSAWTQVLDAAIAAETKDIPPILGSDRDEGAINISQENALRSGVLEHITFSPLAVSAIVPPPLTGWLVTNPPYGIRVSPTSDLRNLYSRLGDLMRSQFQGWHYGILCADPVLAGHTYLKHERVLNLVNGGVAVKFFVGLVP